MHMTRLHRLFSRTPARADTAHGQPLRHGNGGARRLHSQPAKYAPSTAITDGEVTWALAELEAAIAALEGPAAARQALQSR